MLINKKFPGVGRSNYHDWIGLQKCPDPNWPGMPSFLTARSDFPYGYIFYISIKAYKYIYI